ncbi:MAG: thioesterase family protein [Clostridiales bacterium]|jgi:acyl-CoA thioester hydrolase|nr:acyl-CoA thioesterase [Eubacteriales bacterium]MDH7564876.1 thioesterase family protein [Clostridiales bacterium]
MFISETSFIVRYAETDQMGIVHHSNYPVWFEAGRTDFVKKMGMPYSKIEEKGCLLPLVELKCFFKGAARYEDEIIVKTWIKSMTVVRITFYYEVYIKGKPDLITWGETTHAWTNRDLKPVNIKKFCPDVYQLMLRAMEDQKP